MNSRKDLKILKNCPFCGEEAYVGDDWDGRLAVICCLCGCRTMYYRTREEAVKIWNRRNPVEKSKTKKSEDI